MHPTFTAVNASEWTSGECYQLVLLPSGVHCIAVNHLHGSHQYTLHFIAFIFIFSPSLLTTRAYGRIILLLFLLLLLIVLLILLVLVNCVIDSFCGAIYIPVRLSTLAGTGMKDWWPLQPQQGFNWCGV